MSLASIQSSVQNVTLFCKKRFMIFKINLVNLKKKKQRHYFAFKGLSSQSYGFSSSHLWMWELDYKES